MKIGIIHVIEETIKMKELTIITIGIRKKKNPFFCNSYDAIRAYRHKRINLYSPLWLLRQLDQCLIASKEAPLKVHYEYLGTYHEI